MADRRRDEFERPSFNRAFLIPRRDADSYDLAVEIAWQEVLDDDGWYDWLVQNYDRCLGTGSVVTFEDRADLKIRKAPGRSSVYIYVPASMPGPFEESVAVMRTVIAGFYSKLAHLLDLELPPDVVGDHS